MKTLLAACLLLLLLAGSARAQNSESPRTDINPALLYYRAFEVEPHLEQDTDYLYTNEWKAHLDEQFGKLVAEYDNTFQLVRQAADSKVPCDWGIDWSSGPSTLLPHLAQAKSVERAAGWRVKWDLQNGRQDDAREDLLAAVALGRNLTRDGTLISVLLQFSIENMVYSSVAGNFSRFSPEQLQKIVDGLDAGPARGTVTDALTTERAIFIQNWLLRKIEDLRKANPGDERKRMDGIRELMTSAVGQTNFWPKVERASGGTSEGVLRLVHEYADAEFRDRMTQWLALPGAEFQAKEGELQAEAINSPNPFIATVVPPFLKSRAKELRMSVLLAEVHAALEFKLHGESGLNSVPDPCGNGPFKFERFFFEGVDRGFKLTSAFNLPDAAPSVLIFVEKEGPAFEVDGAHPGTPPIIPSFSPPGAK